MDTITTSQRDLTSFLTDRLTRRTAFRRLAGSGLVAASAGALARVTTVRAEESATEAPFTGITYVGETSDPYLLAAVEIGEGASEGKARAYICKTPVHMPGGIDEWLTGTFDGVTLALTAETGATLEGTLAYGGITGTLTLVDGANATYEVARATGPGGLYQGPRTDRLLRAASIEGGTLEELVAAVPDETYVPADHWQIGHERQAYPAAAILTPREGPPQVITTYYDQTDDSERLRVIVTNDGKHNGAGKSTTTGDWTCRDWF